MLKCKLHRMIPPTLACLIIHASRWSKFHRPVWYLTTMGHRCWWSTHRLLIILIRCWPFIWQETAAAGFQSFKSDNCHHTAYGWHLY